MRIRDLRFWMKPTAKHLMHYNKLFLLNGMKSKHYFKCQKIHCILPFKDILQTYSCMEKSCGMHTNNLFQTAAFAFNQT